MARTNTGHCKNALSIRLTLAITSREALQLQYCHPTWR